MVGFVVLSFQVVGADRVLTVTRTDKQALVLRDELKVGQPIAAPLRMGRIWRVARGVPVWPVEAVSSTAVRICGSSTTQLATTREWVFTEGQAHLLRQEYWQSIESVGWLYNDPMTPRRPIYVDFGHLCKEGEPMGFIVAGLHISTDDSMCVNLALGLDGASLQPHASRLVRGPNNSAVFSTDGSAKRIIGEMRVSPTKRNMNKSFLVSVYEDRTVGCTCPAWTETRRCWHMVDPSVLSLLGYLAP